MVQQKQAVFKLACAEDESSEWMNVGCEDSEGVSDSEQVVLE